MQPAFEGVEDIGRGTLKVTGGGGRREKEGGGRDGGASTFSTIEGWEDFCITSRSTMRWMQPAFEGVEDIGGGTLKVTGRRREEGGDGGASTCSTIKGWDTFVLHWRSTMRWGRQGVINF
jgi:hypothetical protein